jgi:hypothetical protein
MGEEMIECGYEGGREFPRSHFREIPGRGLIHWTDVAPHTLLGDLLDPAQVDVPLELPAGAILDVELPDADLGDDPNQL